MVLAGIPREEIRHTRAVQDWLADSPALVPVHVDAAFSEAVDQQVARLFGS